MELETLQRRAVPFVTVARVHVSQILPLRRDVFDPQGYIAESYALEDGSAQVKHFAAFAERWGHSYVVSCGSYSRSVFSGEPAWLLCSVATHPLYRRQGFGFELLSRAEEMLCEEFAIRSFFCHSRLSAVPFYRSLGWECVGKEFLAADGKDWHILMCKELPLR